METGALNYLNHDSIVTIWMGFYYDLLLLVNFNQNCSRMFIDMPLYGKCTWCTNFGIFMQIRNH